MPRRTTTKRVPRIVPALTARTQFGQILRRVMQDKEKFVVERRGEAQAVIISVEEYLRDFPPLPILEEIWQESKAKGRERLTLREINNEIKRYRRERAKKAQPK